jgi:intein-encoded DNA endonuclease-like protein
MVYDPESATSINQFSVSRRVEMYERAIELREKNGWGQRRIAEELGLKAGTVKGWIYDNKRPDTHFNIPDLTPSPSLSYIIGTVEGDGWTTNHIERDGVERHRIGLQAISYEFVAEFRDAIENIVGKKYNLTKRQKDEYSDTYVVKLDNLPLFDFLERPRDDHRDRISEYPSGFIRGLFDSEGTPKQKANMIECYNTDCALLRFTSDILSELEIDSSLGTKDRDESKIDGREIKAKKQLYVLRISGSDVSSFYECVGFTIPEKKQKLEEMI